MVRFLLMAACLLAAPSASAEMLYWEAEMRAVHANYTGPGGRISRFGDSISYSMAFFYELRWGHSNTSPADDAALTWLRSYMTTDSWDWQQNNPQSHGAYTGWRSSKPLEIDQSPTMRNIDLWLQNDNPAIAVIMFGTNDVGDVGSVTVDAYQQNMRQIVQAVKANGTIPILMTIPPHYAHFDRSAEFAEAVRELALELKVPLIDYFDEIVTRNPDGAWNGGLLNFEDVHPNNVEAGRRNFSEAALNSNGFTLRNWLTLHALHEVSQLGFSPPLAAPEPAAWQLAALGAAVFLGGGWRLRRRAR